MVLIRLAEEVLDSCGWVSVCRGGVCVCVCVCVCVRDKMHLVGCGIEGTTEAPLTNEIKQLHQSNRNKTQHNCSIHYPSTMRYTCSI